jgi:hypothetical protein
MAAHRCSNGGYVLRARPAFLLAAFLGASVTAEAQIRPGQVTGVVRDELRTGVPGVTVVLDSAHIMKRAVTDSLGRFAFTAVDSGPHLVRAVRIGFRPFERLLEVGARGTFIEIEMPRLAQLDTIPIRARRSGVFGKVLARDGYRGVPDAEVTVVGARAAARTDTAGDFNLPSVGNGAHVVSVQRGGFASQMLSVVVPDEGGIELSVVLEPTSGGEKRKHSQILMAEFNSRSLMRGTNAALVPRQEFYGRYGLTLRDALRFSPSFLLSGLVIDDSVTCVFVNGEAAPGRTASEFAAEEVVAVEVFGLRGDYTTTLTSRWPHRQPCGHGGRNSPESSGRTGLQTGGRSGRIPADNIVRSIVIWTVR